MICSHSNSKFRNQKHSRGLPLARSTSTADRSGTHRRPWRCSASSSTSATSRLLSSASSSRYLTPTQSLHRIRAPHPNPNGRHPRAVPAPPRQPLRRHPLADRLRLRLRRAAPRPPGTLLRPPRRRPLLARGPYIPLSHSTPLHGAFRCCLYDWYAQIEPLATNSLGRFTNS
jgi:hypothetical protein